MSSEEPPIFEKQAAAVLSRLGRTMNGLIEAIPAAGKIRRATDLQKILGIRSTLAWQVFRLATAKSPIDEARGIPGPTAMERFLEAATKRRVPGRQVDEVR